MTPDEIESTVTNEELLKMLLGKVITIKLSGTIHVVYLDEDTLISVSSCDKS